MKRHQIPIFRISIATILLLTFNWLTAQNKSDHLFSSKGVDSITGQPSLYWGTFFHSIYTMESTAGRHLVCDTFGNIYIAGETTGTTIIATPGCYQPDLAGISDGFIQKFNWAGERVWGTYYGGNEEDCIMGITIDHDGNLIIGGWTASIDGIATPGAYQDTFGGGSDCFIVKMTPDGERLWGTYLGGIEQDWVYCVSIDIYNNILVSGSTETLVGFVTPGCHQSTYGGSPWGDGFYAKFDTNGELLYCTYYGGEGFDVAHTVNSDSKGYVYVGGSSESLTNIGTPGTHQPYNDNGVDGFIVKFDTAGIRVWGTYFGGYGTDDIMDMCFDSLDNIYAVGATDSWFNNIATPGAHKEFSEGPDGFISKFSSESEQIWGTYFGGDDLEKLLSIAIDKDNSCIVAGGFSKSTYGVATTGAHQFYRYSNNPDGVLTGFSLDGQQFWGTYIGGHHQEYLGDVALDLNANLYYVGRSSSDYSEYITTPNCFQEFGQNWSTYFGRFSFDSIPVSTHPISINKELEIFPNPCIGDICKLKSSDLFSEINIYNSLFQKIQTD
ncbi:MAG: hypothetical protein K8R68_00805 [Bacteroidales bacterium]|nr:hypothetical protein [Bacteroidales bacterium]